MVNRYVSKFSDGLVKFIGVILLIFSIMAVVQGVFTLQVNFYEGRFGFNYDMSGENGQLRITGVTKDFPAEQSGLQKYDLVILINGNAPDSKTPDIAWSNAVAGSTITMTVIRKGQQLEIRMTRKLLPFMKRLLNAVYYLVLPLLMLVYILVGLWGIHRHPSFITNLIALVCFFFGIMMGTTDMAQTSVITPLTRHLYFFQLDNILGGIGGCLAPAFWVYLFVNFPNKSRFYQRHKMLTIFLIFSLPLSFYILSWTPFPNLVGTRLFFVVYTILAYGYIFFGIGILTRGARKVSDTLKRRQYRLLSFGIKTGALAIGIGFGCFYLSMALDINTYISLLTFFLALVCQVVSLVLPFTFLNSFFHNKLLETESGLKRKLRHIAASFVLFSLYLGAAFLLGQWVVNKFKLTDPSPIVFVVLLLSLTFSPLHSLLVRWLEEKLYPERNRYKNALKEMTKRMSGFIEESQILESLSHWFSETMGIRPVYAVSFDRAGAMKIPLKLHSPRSVTEKVKDGSNFYWDEISDSEGAVDVIDEDEKEWALRKGISVTVPMISRGEPVGLLSIGKKKNREDFTGDDLEIFKEAAFQTAVALQNIKLQMVHLEKKRLDKELEVAREIQGRLVPGTIPVVEGLEVHGHYQPCFEVGGDYFDIIPMGEGRTALVIADVSGKGAGAALLMSNLQASLRMAVSFSR
ncbi:MAG: PDZ domain-containing protein, partial [bacterium]|nr:PDZ domain-containing protein [bacterium]